MTRFRAACDRAGARCVYIVLARGACLSQPMATLRTAGTLDDARDAAQRLSTRLRREGFAVTRVKIEVATENADVPAADADALQRPDSHYFEHHLKLALPADQPTDALLDLCARHGAHLSRNAFKRRDDGREERFATLRHYGVGRETSDKRRRALHDELLAAEFEVVKVESEYCVYDSNVELDAGWLTEGVGA